LICMRAIKKKRIQVYIEPQQDRVLDLLSKQKSVSKAHLIREGILRFFKDLPVEEDPAMDLLGLGGSGKGNLSEDHDRYVAERRCSRKR
jgi:hypothetical protein